MTMKMYCKADTIPGSCGLGYVRNYFHANASYGATRADQIQVGGTGFFTAAFVNTLTCKDMFNVLVSKYKVVMQSPTRRNENSGNGFFFLILDRSNRKKLGYTPIEAKWPWKTNR